MPFSRSQNSNTAKKSAFIIFSPTASNCLATTYIVTSKSLQFGVGSSKLSGMMEPLALVLYEKLLPGSQVVNRLQDLKYRVETISDATRLVECAQQSGPMIVLVDLESAKENVCAEIARLKQTPATRHLPVIAFSNERLTI